MYQNFSKTFHFPVPAALFLSGSGTNAEKLLLDQAARTDCPWTPSVMVTDRPETSRARELAARFGIPLVEHDIGAFYRERGCARVTIMTPEGMRVREEWTESLRRKLAPYPIGFGILAGFVPLSNITADFPCLNVHPGDLTVVENGHRIFAGLHLLPLETAILHGCPAVRSSVILTQPITVGAAEMDAGPVLGVSEYMPLDLLGRSTEDYRAIAAARVGKVRRDYADDPLAHAAEVNVDRLKEAGDWVLFPQVVRDFASGKFAFPVDGGMTYDGLSVRTVEYSRCAPPRGV